MRRSRRRSSACSGCKCSLYVLILVWYYKAMRYDARYVANLILTSYDAKSYSISNKKLNKIIYFVHGHMLADRRVSVLRNHAEAWDHGPVYSVVYHSFKRYGYAPISDLASYFDYGLGHNIIADPADIEAAMRQPILRIVSRYVGYSASHLEMMTHDPSGPWAKAYSQQFRGLSNRINEDVMARYFLSLPGAHQ